MQDARAKLRTLLIVAAVFAAWLGAGLAVTNSYYRLVLTLVPSAMRRSSGLVPSRSA